ncbi:aegerolysin type hemolysin [Terfezia claveryi]|nr:aegerolysin type hemolysin [Terfezia claveryi]
MSDIGVLTYAHWLGLKLANCSTGSPIWITHLDLPWGKLYDGVSKDNEIPISAVVGKGIRAQESFTIWSCGQANATSGTEGIVTLSTAKTGGSVVIRIHWYCPYRGTNNLEKLGEQHQKWIVDVPSISPDGAIGEKTVTFVNFRT